MRLSEIQTRFKDLLLGHPAALDNVAFGNVFEPGDIALSERLKVYRNNVMGNVGNAVINNFPLIEKLVGREFLTVMARQYVLENPPQSGHLTFYGSDFDQFISTYEAAKDLPYLADVARLEIAINASYHAFDDEALSADDLAAIPQSELENYNLKLRKSVFVMRSNYPLDDIRDLCLSSSEQNIDLTTGGVALLVHRPELNVHVTKISDAEYEFLKALKIKNLGDALADSLQIHADFDFQNARQRFMTLEIFAKTDFE
jgi:hypothetical protein